MDSNTDDYLARLAAIRHEMHQPGGFPYFAEKCLKIRPKTGNIVPLILNAAQKIFYAKIMEQYSLTGRIRAIVCKGRQQGLSTVTEAYFMERITAERGRKAFILCHNTDTTKEVLQMVHRFYDNIPEYYRPVSGKKSTTELDFPELDSSYSIGTAGTADVGRGFTINYIHGSEVAMWKNGADIVAGLFNACPDVDDTAIILESTARGKNNIFYQIWQGAENGDNGFIQIFIPWYLQPEYTAQPPSNFELTSEETELKHIYKLTDGQLYWRRKKISTSSYEKFRQEYPFTPEEAFLEDDGSSFINLMDIERARTSTHIFENNKSPIVIGVDTARGRDDSCIVVRQGREILSIDRFKNSTTSQLVHKVKQAIYEYKPAKVFVETCGIGWATYDPLVSDGFGYCCVPVNTAESADDKSRYRNKRAEMYDRLRIWLSEPPCKIPDDNLLISDLASITLKPYDAEGRIFLESKENIKKVLGRSPDTADALALTFAYDVSNMITSHNKVFNDLRKLESSVYIW